MKKALLLKAVSRSVELGIFLDAVTRWAESRGDIVGLALVGSHARAAARPDSDIDLIVLCDNPRSLTDDPSWTARFGDARKTATECYGPMTSTRVYYKRGWEVEFGVADPDWASLPLDSGTRRVISDGIRILYDPAGILAKAKAAAACRRLQSRPKERR